MVGVRGFGYTEGGLSLRPLDMTPCYPLYTHDGDAAGCRNAIPAPAAPPPSVCKQTIGQPNHRQNKVILLFGDDDASKGSFKDALVNYVFGVQICDTHRLILVDDYTTEDRPDVIRVYVINTTEGSHQDLTFNIVLVDVPPLGSVGGAERDVSVMRVLWEFLGRDFGSTLVDSINLVVSSSSYSHLYTLANTFKLLCLYFNNLESITQILVTESTSYMPLLNSLKEYDIKYKNFFIFDNGRESENISEEEHFFIQVFQHYDYHGVEDFFQELVDMTPQEMSRGNYEDARAVIRDLTRLRVVRRYSEVVETDGGLTLRQVVMQKEYHDEHMKVQVLSTGERLQDGDSKPTRAMLLVGNKLSGKTTLLTAIVNHIFGVQYDDDFRLLVSGDPLGGDRGGGGGGGRLQQGKEHHQHHNNNKRTRKTKTTTAYIFHGLPISPYDAYRVILIDTPGLKGGSEDQTHKLLVSGLTSLRRQCGIQQYDVIGYVAQADIHKFPDSYRTVYKHLYSLLTDEWTEKLIVLATQSDAKRPPVIAALRNLGIPVLRSYRFNAHTILTSDVHSTDDADPTHATLTRLYWQIEQCSLRALCGEMVT